MYFGQQYRVQLFPHPGFSPGVEPVPQRHTAASHLVGEVLPGDAGLEYKEDAGESEPIALGRLAPFARGPVLGDKWIGE